MLQTWNNASVRLGKIGNKLPAEFWLLAAAFCLVASVLGIYTTIKLHGMPLYGLFQFLMGAPNPGIALSVFFFGSLISTWFISYCFYNARYFYKRYWYYRFYA